MTQVTKKKLNLKKEFDEINRYCKKKLSGFPQLDVDSQIFLKRYNLKYNKVASAMHKF